MGFFDALPPRVSVYEVGPRDGLQNESALVATHSKARLIQALVAAGLKRIEAASFVSPRWVPQMADAEEVMRMVPRDAGVRYTALCPNRRGLDRALSAGVDEVGVFLSASETHNRKNVNKTVPETLAAFEQVIGPAREAGLAVRGYVSTLWGCPYEGEVDPRRGLELARILLDQGCYQVSLGDTIGVGTPLQTRRIVELFLAELPAEQVALHLHDTRGTALANVVVGLELGITTFDASIGGLGGCPYAPGAAGNLATEDLVYTLHGMGVETGVDLDRLWQAGQVAQTLVGHPLPGKVHKAGVRSLSQ
ncbi:MAG TPA: hydroxymethylglutaryl-CoA lyase [Polyangiaceae bacterium LLY-WYZ-14_1]|jgi:hydroxymethylglutaryl-CoA lyase|nr:hydroxymethylglutaryl-CoA lyase [Polyangiaceae bacterium LLY-WYZ-14_1]